MLRFVNLKDDMELGLKDTILQTYFLHQRKIHAWTAFGIGCAVLTISFLTHEPIAHNYIVAKTDSQRWKDAPTDETLAAQMRKSVKKVPGLELALESEIAQTYLAQGLAVFGMRDAARSLARLQEVSPLHAEFAAATLLIETGKFQEALEIAVSLKEEMESKFDNALWKGSRTKAGSALYVCNLLRIAFLQKQLSNRAGELAAWEEVKGLLEMDGTHSVAAQLLQNNFGSEQFSLADFISQRERAIVYRD